MRRLSLRADSRCCSGNGIATSSAGRRSWRGRSWSPFVPALSHSRKLYRSATGEPAAASPATPPSASVTLGCYSHSSNSFLPSTCSSHTNLSPTTTTSSLSLGTVSSRPRLHIASRTSLLPYSPKILYSQQATPRRDLLPIMYEGKWSAVTVRQTFFDYFAERGHTIGTMQTQWPHACATSMPSIHI